MRGKASQPRYLRRRRDEVRVGVIRVLDDLWPLLVLPRRLVAVVVPVLGGGGGVRGLGFFRLCVEKAANVLQKEVSRVRCSFRCRFRDSFGKDDMDRTRVSMLEALRTEKEGGKTQEKLGTRSLEG